MADVWDLIKIEVLSSLLSCGSAEGEAAAGRFHEAVLQVEAVPQELTISGAGREEFLQSDTGPVQPHSRVLLQVG